jgi:isochorismate pyruvate lyase
MKEPEDCASIEDVREALDSLDQTLVEILGRRAGYARAAARFKKSEADVHVPERVAAMLVERRAWAEAHGLDPAFVEALFGSILEHFLAEERRAWARRWTRENER